MTWVLLRGLMREQRHWEDFPARLAAAYPDERILTPDFPGNGSRWQETSPIRISAMTDFLREELKRENADQQPVSVIAISLGGMVATDWISRFPHEVRRLVLINTSLAGYHPFYRRLKPENYPALLAQLWQRQPAQRERLLLNLTSQRHQQNPAVLDRFSSYAQECPVTRKNALRQLSAAIRFHAPRQTPAVPLLILAGAKDRLVDPGCSLSLAQHWKASCAVHPDAGHDLPLDDPDWIIRQIRQWASSP
jgi:pimeloyl-ACP methyl ester carboxylesterase